MSQFPVVFVYEHKNTGEIMARWLDESKILDADDRWLHIGSLEPRSYISSLLTEYPELVRKMKGDGDGWDD